MFQWLWLCRVLRNMARGVRMLVWSYPKYLIWLPKKACRTWIPYVRGCRGKGHWFWNGSSGYSSNPRFPHGGTRGDCLFAFDGCRIMTFWDVCPQLSHQPKDKTTTVPFLRCLRCFHECLCLVACIWGVCVSLEYMKQDFVSIKISLHLNTLKFTSTVAQASRKND